MKKKAREKYSLLPGNEWFWKKYEKHLKKYELKGYPPKSEVVQKDAIADVVEEDVKRWADASDIPTKGQAKKAIEEANRNDIAESIAKYEALKPFIEECRLELFGTKETPFSTDSQGFEKAKTWLEQTYKEQHDNRTHYNVSLIGGAILTKSAFEEFTRFTWGGEPPDSKKFRQAFIKTLKDAERTHYPAFDIPTPLFNLTLDKHDFSIYVASGTKLCDLVGRIETAALQLRWFTVSEIIRFVFFDVALPMKSLIETSYTLGPPSFDPDHPNSITITIRGSVSEDEVLKAYRGELKKRGLKVRKKSLSYQAQRVLIFVNEHRANKTWDELTAMWNTECKRDKKLKTYGAKSRGGLLQAFNRAVAQASWKDSKF
jgi:hypothetical protein